MCDYLSKNTASSFKKDTYLVEGKAISETISSEFRSSSEYGMHLAMKKVSEHQGMGAFFSSGIKMQLECGFGVMPVVMCIGTIGALVLANKNWFLEVLGTPFVPLLKLLQIPEAELASKTMIVDFTDMLSIYHCSKFYYSSNDKIYCCSNLVTQLIYLSEVGGLILAGLKITC